MNKKMHFEKKTVTQYSQRGSAARIIATCHNSVVHHVITLDSVSDQYFTFNDESYLESFVGKTAKQLLAEGFHYNPESISEILIDDQGRTWEAYDGYDYVMCMTDDGEDLKYPLVDCEIDDDTFVVAND